MQMALENLIFTWQNGFSSEFLLINISIHIYLANTRYFINYFNRYKFCCIGQTLNKLKVNDQPLDLLLYRETSRMINTEDHSQQQQD
jgi:hypothetical protein